MPRGRAWAQREISCLLALVEGSGEVTLLMASTSRPNEALWRAISQGLAAAGYSRSVAQCRSKWKALKQAFYSERETWRRAGSHSPRLPPHYKAMKRIWKAAGQPVFGERRLPDLVKSPPGKRRTRLEAQPPSSSGCIIHMAIPATPPSPRGQCAKRELASPAHVDQARQVQTAPSPIPHTDPLLARPPTLDSPAAGQVPSGLEFGEQELPDTIGDHSAPETTADEEQPLLGVQTLAPGLQDNSPITPGPGVVSLLHSMQQLLVHILHTSRQQQVLLESLASDTVSHLHLISDSLVQVGETLHELLLQAHARSASLPTSLSHYLSPMPQSPCTPDPPASPDHKEEPVMAPASGFWPRHRAPP